MSYVGLSEHINFDQLMDPVGRLRLEAVIGEGTYGEVFRAVDLQTGQLVAVKIMENIADNIEEIEEEYVILRDLCLHPNVPVFYGLYMKRHTSKREEDQLWFVLELCSGGSVTDLVHGLARENRRLTEEQIAYIIRETLEGLMYLNRNHCMHRDIKGHNILLTGEAEVKLIDYGVSSHTENTLGRRNTSVGTPYWMAPEVIACEQQLDYSYDIRCDVWSVGITAIELADGDPPLSEMHPMRALFQIPRNPPPTLAHPCEWSSMFNDFISCCLVKDFEKRPFANQLLEHPFLKQVPPNPDSIRIPLKRELERQRGLHLKRRAPEMTTKQGKLKVDRKAKLQKIYLDDLASMENLTIETIVDQLEKRYINGVIYTYIGDILVSLNPFADLGIYTDKEVHMYRNRARCDNPPHVFAVADSAYHAMLHQKASQCIVISGESGAGKTVTANLLLKQLVTLGKAPNRDLESKILQMNPIMEAFGNARTGINDNSSRFGKYLDVTFSAQGMVSGAKLSVYLLEHSRVVQQAQNERNFHIFYYLCDGLAAENKLRDYHLDESKRVHHYVTLPDLDSPERKQNVEKFKLIRKGFDQLGFAADELDSIYSILAAIIHLGDVNFAAEESKDNTERCRLTNPVLVNLVGKLLGVEPSAVLEALTSVSVVTRGETITRRNSLEEAVATRDAMAKGLYARLFDWIVNQINRHLSFGRLVYGEPVSVALLDIFGFENHQSSSSGNSFEQLCINIANEQIQYFFNQHIFTWEQQEYMAEGINVAVVEYTDNRPVLDMFLSKPLGLLALLDEESRFPGATHSSLIEKFNNNIRSEFYVRSKSTNDVQFTIQHYAGRVTYNSTSLLEKNRNFLPPEVVQLLRTSCDPIVRFLFQCPLTKTGNLWSKSPYGSPVLGRKSPVKVLPGGKVESFFNDKLVQFDSGTMGNSGTKGLASQTRVQQTVATYFRNSLMELLQKMIAPAGTDPHFIRCIKPNDVKRAGLLDRTKIAQQLRYTGVLETVRIRKQGFSHRLSFADFLRRYCFLAFGFDERVVADRETCQKLLTRMKLDGWAVGKTKVFLKYYHVEYLSKVYDQQIRRIVRVQACVRRWLAKIRLSRQSAKKSTIRKRSPKLEQESRKHESTPNNKQMVKRQESQPKPQINDDKEEAALMIQKHYRGYHVRLKYHEELIERYQENASLQKKHGLPKNHEDANRQPLYASEPELDEKTKNSIRRRRQEMVAFADQIYKLSQESHQVMRRCKPSVTARQLLSPPDDYARPNGFKIIPAMLSQQIASQSPNKPKIQVSKNNLYDQPPHDESRGDDELGEDDDWDTPIKRVSTARRMRGQKVDVKQEMREALGSGGGLIMSQNRLNIERENQMISQWQNLYRTVSPERRLAPKPPVPGVRGPHHPMPNSKPVGKLFPEPEAAGRKGLPPSNLGMAPGRRFSKENILSPTDRTGGQLGGLHREAAVNAGKGVLRQGSLPESSEGPVDYRKMLRKTDYAPTETLRKMKEQP